MEMFSLRLLQTRGIRKTMGSMTRVFRLIARLPDYPSNEPVSRTASPCRPSPASQTVSAAAVTAWCRTSFGFDVNFAPVLPLYLSSVKQIRATLNKRPEFHRFLLFWADVPWNRVLQLS